MANIKINESFNVRTLSAYFESVIKKANYKEDITIEFPENTYLDLAGLQILVAMKKELDANGKNLTVVGAEESVIKYLKS